MMKKPLLLLVVCIFSCVEVQAGSSASIALVGGRLIDGFGGPPLDHSVVLIEGERITAVGTVDSLAVPAAFTEISTAGMSVLPGLWDAHVHTYLAGHSEIGRAHV